MLAAAARSFNGLLHRPTKILWLCVALAAASLALDGSALRLWSMRRDRRALERRIEDGRAQARTLEFRIHEAQQPEFIERQARDQFDLVKEGDLVFVFSDDGADSRPTELRQDP
jgi:cell division protein FtsB